MVRVIGHTLAELDELSEEFEARVETALRTTIYKAIPAYTIEPLTASVVAAAGDSIDDLSEISYVWNEQVDDLSLIVGGVYEGGALAIGYDVVDHLDLGPGEGIPALPDDFAITYLKGASNRLKGVGEVLWQNVRSELLAGHQAGESVDQLALRVQAALGSTESRAKTIARTEIVAASNAGSLAQLQFVGLEAKKEWISTHDARTRPSHILANGQTVDRDGTFLVGGSHLRFPGDPAGAAGQVVNCRCTLAYEFPEESQPEFTCVATPDNLITAAVVPASAGCMCPAPNVSPHDVTDVVVTESLKQFIYAQFKTKPISPAYGGAAIYKRLQEVKAQLASGPNANLSEFQLLKIIDALYAAEKGKKNDHGFEVKFNEWLASSAGKKTSGNLKPPTSPTAGTSTPTPTVTTPQPAGIDLIDAWYDSSGVGTIIGEAVTPTGVKMRAKAYPQGLKTEYFENGKWHENSNFIDSQKELDKNHPGVVWTKPTKSSSASPPQSTPQATTGTKLTAPLAPSSSSLPAVPSLPPLHELTFTGKTVGTHGAQIWVDKQGNQWLFKPPQYAGDTFLIDIDVVTAQLQSKAKLQRPGVYEVTLGGKTGSLQHMFDSSAAFPTGFNPKSLSTDEILYIQMEQVFSWLISDHDAHYQQWLRLPDGSLVAIDKGQAFKYFGKDKLDWTYHPNSKYGAPEPIFNIMWRAFANGESIDMLDPSTGELAQFIAQLESLDDVTFREMLRPYAEKAAAQGKLAYKNDVDKFLDAAVARKNSLAKDFNALYAKALAERQKKLGVSATPPPAPPVTPPAVKPIVTPAQMPTPAPTSPTASLADISDFYQAFQSPGKVTPAYPGSKIYRQLQYAKTKLPASMQSLSDSELLELLDQQHTLLYGVKGSGTFKSKTKDWADTPAGQKTVPGGSSTLDAKPKSVAPNPSPAYAPPPPTPTAPIPTPTPSPTPSPGATTLSPTGIAPDVTPKQIAQMMVSGEDASAIVAVNFWKQGVFQKGDVIAVALDAKDVPYRIVAGDKNEGIIYERYENGTWVQVHTAKTSSGVFQFKYDFGVDVWKTPAGTKITEVKTGPAPTPVKKVKKAKKVTPKPTPTATINQTTLIQNGDISGFTDFQQLTVFNEYKNTNYGTQGVYLSSSPADIYVRLVQLRAHLKATDPAFKDITLLQIIRMLDEQGAKKIGATNTYLYETKITDWLKTPTGTKYAQDIASGAVQIPKYGKSSTPSVPPIKKTAGKKAKISGAKLGPGSSSTHHPSLPQQTKPAFTADTQGRTRPPSSEPYKVLTSQEAAAMQDQMLQEEPWTGSQKASLKHYTGSAYTAMNEYLRGNEPATDSTVKHIIEAQKGMRRSTRPIILHRGTNTDQFGFAKFGVPLSVMRTIIGKQLLDHGFMSTSFGGQAAFGGNVLLEFECPTGTPMAYVKAISKFSHENEILLAAGTRYEVQDVIELSPGRYKVKVRVIVV